jgi:predicted dehydrogenase
MDRKHLDVERSLLDIGCSVDIILNFESCVFQIGTGGRNVSEGTMKNSIPLSRRDFIGKSAMGTAGMLAAGTVLASIRPERVVGANDRILIAVIGTNSRGHYLATVFAKNPGSEIKYICDVDSRAVEKTTAEAAVLQGKKPKGMKDFRKCLEDPLLDAVVIAMPDHWHTPAAILALEAGKHVYVEKPCGHNPREGELLVLAQKKYRKIVQMGNQQRSSPESIEIIKEIRNGIIGRPYYGRAWYANNRGPIGFGKRTAVPSWLDYELWQGPAPRTPYRDNIIHYNWHWFWHWGTGETCNNATHELDICRWALNVDYPARVTSAGGRFHYSDDWEAFDTQITGFEFEDGKSIIWEGRSCNPFPVMNRGRGVTIHGEYGTVLIDRNGYVLYDNDNKEVKSASASDRSKTLDTVGGGYLDELHIQNFLDAVRQGVRPNSPIDEGHKSTLLCHLGNIAQRVQRSLDCDPGNGHIREDAEAMKLWSRDYKPGWEPRV